MNRSILLALLLCLTAPAVFAAASPENELTHDLDGTHITYRYDDGSTYDVKYTSAGVMYRFVSGGSPDAWWGPFPYRAFKTADGTFFLGWYEKGYGDQITHLVDLKRKTLYGSGIIVHKGADGAADVTEHFQKARIDKIERDGGR